ncbi:hypothetical protein BDF20DRAFT_873657 [Mycotypha africana]|uniref:uncharacterized protein n=1 Tax=Mycotypha africana TaxID=64632 RepID=UPI002301B86D|nr:uncharacterized protein BDF20DRAFT_873657 [Mycotypha africana]KAI8977226.1 hypothetical protein BDF20DRAFT_873657 [Mycotypha africana]
MLRSQRRTHRFMPWLLAFGTTVFIWVFILFFDLKVLFAFSTFRTNHRYNKVAY